MLRKSLIGAVLTMVIFTGWLFSDDLERPDLASVIKNIQQSLASIQDQIKDLRASVTQLSKIAKTEKQAVAMRSVTNVSSGTASAAPMSTWQRAQEAYDRGKGLEDQKLCGQAIEAFTKAIELDPKNDSAYLHRGACRSQLGNFADAITDLSLSLELQPNNSQAYALRASDLAAGGQTAAAIADANEAIRRNSTNVDNYLLRATLHQRAGEVQPALEDYNQAIAAAPQSEKAYLGRATLLRTSGQLVPSVKDCYKAIELSPSDPAAYLCRAEFYIASGAPQPALADINQALMNGQNPAQAATLLAAAKQAFEMKIAAPPQPPQQPVVTATVAAPAHAAAPAPAIEAAPAPIARTAPVSAPPASAPAPVASAAPLVSVALPPAGMPSPGTLKQSSANPPAALTPAPAAAPRPAEAMVAAPKLVDLQVPVVPVKNTLPQVAVPRGSSGKSERALNLYRDGRKYAEQERFVQAVPLFDQAIQLDSNFTLAYNARCYAFLRLRQYDRAITDCSEAIKLDASYINAYQIRGVAKQLSGDSAGANTDFKRAAELQPIAQIQNTKIPGKQ
jgi:tetratricopeptide (TPR) repeat protein